MLYHYHVKNFALIEDASVDFGPGLNVLTGETGAGKSILIDALNAAMGARTGGEMIRRGASEALVELVFSVESPSLAEALEKLGLVCEEGTLLLSRRIFPGRSLYRINDEAVTSARLRQVTELLLDIHGQHEHQSLLKPGVQLKVLDDFAGEACVRAKKETEEAYEAYGRALRERGQFTLSEEERRRQMDFLDYEIEEITRAGVLPGEREELSARFKEMNAFGKIRAALENSLAFLSEGRENASELLLRAGRELGEAARLAEPLSDINQQVMTAQDIISSAEQDIRSYLETAEFDEGAFFRVEKRLDELNRLELKYGDLSRPENRALEERRQAREELAAYERRLELAQREVEESRERLEAAAEILHQHRMKALPLWDKALSGALKELNFLTVDYQTLWEEAPEIGSEGKDRISFTISLNPGEERRPLQKVASGGELSRIMLAIKTILADRDEIPTVIFDEIDSGISGQTAQAVGRKLKAISRYRQVILITHLPQIAAPADRHYGIEKQVEGERTVTRIRLLQEEESLGELARLLGGDLKSQSVYETARELRESAACSVAR